MSTDTILEIESHSLENTLEIGAKIGAKIQGGEVIELVSDIGGGKTSLVKGLAKGMGSNDQVASPTFTISREYSSKSAELHHYDFYRLNEPGVVKAELAESIENERAAVVVEWAKIVSGALPSDKMTIKIRNTNQENERKLIISAGPNHVHLMKELR